MSDCAWNFVEVLFKKVRVNYLLVSLLLSCIVFLTFITSGVQRVTNTPTFRLGMK